MATDVYQIVTDRIISLLEKGTVPWQRSWSVGPKMAPVNAVSKKPYSGINFFLLGSVAYDSPEWLTYKQAQDLGGHVRKGEKGMPVIFYKTWVKEDENAEGGVKTIPILKYYTVFNADQCDGIDAIRPEIQTWPENQRIEAAETVWRNMPNAPQIEFVGSQPAYYPSQDTVKVPEISRFKSSAEFYSALFHELTHSTGHKSRLDRPEIGNGASFGDRNYSREELVAEMGAAFLCSQCGISNETIENSAAYLQGWLKALKSDSKMVVKAASLAQKAANYILNVNSENSVQ